MAQAQIVPASRIARTNQDTYGRPRSTLKFLRRSESALGHVFGVVVVHWKAPRLDEIRPRRPKQPHALVAPVLERAVAEVG